MSKPTKRIRIFTAEDVAEHKTAESTWVTYKDRVYDITQFLPDHPGGDDIVLKYAGKAVDEIMKDPLEHEHSDTGVLCQSSCNNTSGSASAGCLSVPCFH